ncbi:MAG: Bro-N domain-containing protein [Christensenellales bacterium]
MCNGILTFTNMEFGNIRIVEKDGELWFAASDICKCFGETNRNRAMQELDDDEKGYTQIQTAGGVQRVSIINEPGLYALLLPCNRKKPEEFLTHTFKTGKISCALSDVGLLMTFCLPFASMVCMRRMN